MNELCQMPDCDDFQRVLVGDPVGDTLRVCLEHWRDALEKSSGQICGISLIDCPSCSREGCANDAKTYAPDDGQLPLCHQHLDDLSWIQLPIPLTFDNTGRPGG